jgi:hypothetical protein
MSCKINVNINVNTSNPEYSKKKSIIDMDDIGNSDKKLLYNIFLLNQQFKQKNASNNQYEQKTSPKSFQENESIGEKQSLYSTLESLLGDKEYGNKLIDAISLAFKKPDSKMGNTETVPDLNTNDDSEIVLKLDNDDDSETVPDLNTNDDSEIVLKLDNDDDSEIVPDLNTNDDSEIVPDQNRYDDNENVSNLDNYKNTKTASNVDDDNDNIINIFDMFTDENNECVPKLEVPIKNSEKTEKKKIPVLEKHDKEVIHKFNSIINKIYDPNDPYNKLCKELFMDCYICIDLDMNRQIISQYIDAIILNNNLSTHKAMDILNMVSKYAVSKDGVSKNGVSKDVGKYILFEHNYKPPKYEYIDESNEDNFTQPNSFDVANDKQDEDEPLKKKISTNSFKLKDGEINTSDDYLNYLYSQIQYSKGCACGTCDPPKFISIDPLLSYDRRFFPAPNPSNYRMSQEIWAYPKYTEELSIQEFANQFLMKNKSDGELETKVTSELETKVTSDATKNKLNMVTQKEQTSDDIIDEMINELDTQIEIDKSMIKINETRILSETKANVILDKETEIIMEDDELICPISFEPIVELAMTCYGQIYEKEEIQNWLMEHDTDPLSGRFMFTKQLITKGIDRKNIKYWQKKIRENMQILYNYPIELLYPETKVKEVAEIKKNIWNFDEINQNLWKKYNSNMLLCFRNPSLSKHNINGNKNINNINGQRPPGTGIGFEYIDLSGDYFSKHQHAKQNFKSTSFNGADLSNNVFVECQFSRCTFIGANLSATIFHGCSFLGEEVNFANASSTDETQFIDCKVEDIGDWTSWQTREKVEQSLKRRLLDGSFTVLSFDE